MRPVLIEDDEDTDQGGYSCEESHAHDTDFLASTFLDRSTHSSTIGLKDGHGGATWELRMHIVSLL
jgi:hypothetical protein